MQPLTGFSCEALHSSTNAIRAIVLPLEQFFTLERGKPIKKTIGVAIVGLTIPVTVLAQSATFEANGFPLTLHQAQVTALAAVQERVATPLLELNGIPVSPVQMLVLTPRQVAQKTGVIDRVSGEIEGRWLVPASASGR